MTAILDAYSEIWNSSRHELAPGCLNKGHNQVDDFRRALVFAAWILLVAAAVEVAIGAWTLSGLPGSPAAPYHQGSLFGPATAPPLWMRATVAVPNLVEFTVTALPVAAVLIVALGGCPAVTARRVTLTAVTIQTVAPGLGLVACVAVLGKIGGRNRRCSGRANPDDCCPSVAWRDDGDTAAGGRWQAVITAS